VKTTLNLGDDHFTLLGLPQRYALDRQELDVRRRDLQARVHPDRFAADGAVAQRLAMQWAVRVNEAYQCLKDPLARAAYLCEQRGVAINAERNTAMPTAFLVQQLQWREALDEATDTAEVAALDEKVARQQQDMLAALATSLDQDNNATVAAAQVRALMFVARFRQDIDQRLDELDPQR
jgi:molecular chaperone HscB